MRNVIQIPRADLFDQANILDSDIPESIQLAKRIFLKRLKELLNYMFDNVDDCLFEYADKASNNQQQMEYFDAMREIRLQKQKMTEVFFIEYEKRFKQSLSGKTDLSESSSNLAASISGIAGLSLVDEDDLELSLAVTNMTSKVQTLYREALIATSHRFSHVMSGSEFKSEHQPLSGKILCESFANAVESLSCEVPVKLIVFKLFDKYVVQRLAGAFDEVNGMFIGKGILPTIHYKSPVKSPASRAAATSAPGHDIVDQFIGEEVAYADSATTAPGQMSEQNVFGVMQQLLARNRMGMAGDGSAIAGAGGAGFGQSAGVMSAGAGGIGTGTGSGSGVAGGGYHTGASGSGSAGGQTYMVNDIINGLSGLQNQFTFYSQTNDQYGAAGADNAVAGASGMTSSSSGAGQVSTAQAIKVQLVEALTDGNDAKKKALSDTESDVIDIVSMMFDFILDDKSLPDKLKALIAKLQIPFIKLAILDKSFFAKKSHPARQLLNELAYSDAYFEADEELDDDSLFKMIEEVVERVINEYESDEEIFQQLLDEFIEFREQELEANRLAKELMEHAKQSVAAEIEHRVRNNKMPEVIRSLLLKQWKDVMNSIGVRDGCEGIAWDAAIAVMDDLIWSVQPKLIVQEKSQLTKLIPRILNGLQDGLILIGYQQQDIMQLFEELEQLHHASLRGLSEVGIKRTSMLSISGAEDDEEEIVLASEEALEYGAFADANTDSSFYYVVKGMEQGTWVTFTIDGQQKRGRLAWKCDFTGEYTFVDRKYKLVQDLTINDLLEQLDSGTAAICEEIPLFDRAVDAVVKGLKQCLFSEEEIQPASN